MENQVVVKTKAKRKRMTHKITRFDSGNIKGFVSDLQRALTDICNRYGTKAPVIGDIKFKETEAIINHVAVKLPDIETSQKELNIIDLSKKVARRVRRKTKEVVSSITDSVKAAGIDIGNEFKSGYKTFKILGKEGDKFLAITRRHKTYLLSEDEIHKMKLISSK